MLLTATSSVHIRVTFKCTPHSGHTKIILKFLVATATHFTYN
jgi:hypothetical protein